VDIVRYIEHICIRDDTFDALALKYYNEETLSNYIIEANPDYTGCVMFEGGERLQIPVLDMTVLPDSLPPWKRT